MSDHGWASHGETGHGGVGWQSVNLSRCARSRLRWRRLPAGPNLAARQSVTFRVNDRGTFIPERVIDVSRSAGEEPGMIDSGITKVKLDVQKQGYVSRPRRRDFE